MCKRKIIGDIINIERSRFFKGGENMFWIGYIWLFFLRGRFFLSFLFLKFEKS